MRKYNQNKEVTMKKNKTLLTDFVKEDRFELNAYLSYLFCQWNTAHKKQLRGNQ